MGLHYQSKNCDEKRVAAVVHVWQSSQVSVCKSDLTKDTSVYDICRLQTADCMRQQDCKLNETKNIVIKVASSSTLLCSEKYRNEVYIFHANYTDLIPEGVVGCSSHIELEQNNVCRCHKLAHESIATG